MHLGFYKYLLKYLPTEIVNIIRYFECDHDFRTGVRKFVHVVKEYHATYAWDFDDCLIDNNRDYECANWRDTDSDSINEYKEIYRLRCIEPHLTMKCIGTLPHYWFTSLPTSHMTLYFGEKYNKNKRKKLFCEKFEELLCAHTKRLATNYKLF